MRNVVLFGAGASYGSPNIRPTAPPLGRQLFARLTESFPQSTARVPGELVPIFEENFEKGMATAIADDLEFVGPLMQGLTEFFARFHPDSSGDDSYARFVRRLRGTGAFSRTLFSSLNYECVFELACNNADIPHTYDDPVIIPYDEMACVAKLHGSCNLIPGQYEVQRGVVFGPLAEWDAPLEYVNPLHAIRWVRGDTALYAAMCMIAANKPIQFSKPYFAELWRRWAEFVADAERVVVVGVRPQASSDPHLWQPLNATEAAVTFVGSKAAFEEWLPQREGRPTHYLGRDFDRLTDQVADELLRLSTT